MFVGNKNNFGTLRTVLVERLSSSREGPLSEVSLYYTMSCNIMHYCFNSYDERFAIWDVRNMSKPLKDISLGGGIWRIKWNTFSSDYAAAACMHNHFSVVKTHLKSPEPIEMVDVYEKHESLAYGIDWCRKIEHDVHTLASCSFYDHSLHLWKLPISAI